MRAVDTARISQDFYQPLNQGESPMRMILVGGATTLALVISVTAITGSAFAGSRNSSSETIECIKKDDTGTCTKWQFGDKQMKPSGEEVLAADHLAKCVEGPRRCDNSPSGWCVRRCVKNEK